VYRNAGPVFGNVCEWFSVYSDASCQNLSSVSIVQTAVCEAGGALWDYDPSNSSVLVYSLYSSDSACTDRQQSARTVQLSYSNGSCTAAPPSVPGQWIMFLASPPVQPDPDFGGGGLSVGAIVGLLALGIVACCVLSVLSKKW
jgi:hypothetical protein